MTSDYARWLVLAAVSGLVACSGNPEKPTDARPDPTDPTDPGPPDADGDGLTDEEELALGSDPQSADTDADGLGDLEETQQGTDLLNPDTDGDTYRDGDEVATGHSPLDPSDRIYLGNWPFNPDKDAIADPGFVDAGGALTAAELGGTLPRFAWFDQHGQEVDIYDFGGHGKMVVVDLSGVWCPPCHELAFWVDGQPSYYDALYEPYEIIRASVEAGELYWITIIDSNSTGGPATEQTIANWVGLHPSTHVPVLLDADTTFLPWISGGGDWFYPSYVVLDANMEIVLMPTLSDFGEHIIPALAAMLEQP